MNLRFNLSPRLALAADFVRCGGKIADIGTDHAYLPCYLILNGISKSAVAADLRKGPLDNAKKNVCHYELTDKIELRLSDGLDKILPEETDDIIIAGMGGTLIKEILVRAPWIKNENKRLILQPMSHVQDVREFLCENGFTIEKEAVAEDSDKLYICICAGYSGQKDSFKRSFYYHGLLNPDDALQRKYLEKQVQHLKVKYSATKNKEIEEILEEYKKILN